MGTFLQIAALFALFICLIPLWAYVFKRSAAQNPDLKRYEQGATNIARDFDRLYAGRHEFAEANESDFSDLTLEVYERIQECFEKHGFRKLVDLENKTLSSVHPDSRTFSRMFINDTGTVIGAFTQFNSTLGLSIGSSLEDGSVIATTRANIGVGIETPAEINNVYLDSETPFGDVLLQHDERMREHIAKSSGSQPIVIRTVEDLIAEEHRIQDLKVAFHKEKGGITGKEVFTGVPEELEETAQVVGGIIDERRGKERGGSS